MKKLIVFTIIGVVLVWSMGTFAAEFKFIDGTLIRGEIQGERVRIKTQFGELTPKVSDLTFVSNGKIELRDGSQVVGDLLPEQSPAPAVSSGTEGSTMTSSTSPASQPKGLMLKTKYGTFELVFSINDIEYIDFSK